MASSAEPTFPRPREVSLESIIANSPNANSKQLRLTILIEFLRCMFEGATAENEETTARVVAVSGEEMNAMHQQLLRLFEEGRYKDGEPIYWLNKLRRIFIIHDRPWLSSSRPDPVRWCAWRRLLIMLLLDMPEFMDQNKLGVTGEFVDNDDRLGYEETFENASAKVLDWLFEYRSGREEEATYAENMVTTAREESRRLNEQEKAMKLERESEKGKQVTEDTDSSDY